MGWHALSIAKGVAPLKRALKGFRHPLRLEGHAPSWPRIPGKTDATERVPPGVPGTKCTTPEFQNTFFDRPLFDRLPLPIAAIVTLLIVLVAASAKAEPPMALPVDGKPFPAELVAADADWRLTFVADGTRRDLSAADLVRWGTCAEPRRGPAVVLADGGLLLAQAPTADKRNVDVESDRFGPVRRRRAAR